MRAKVAKTIRKMVYADGVTSVEGRSYATKPNGQVVSDSLRQRYQRAKKIYNEG
ncbi:MAG: hypothetical protein GY820_38975 [Gammaproteobacteria bacterium]|nr:hypothetical protein [Gammaproteobacteria bacterium]